MGPIPPKAANQKAQLLHIFVDANVYVRYFERYSDNLSHIEFLSTVVRNKQAKLWLPEHTVREFWRNREKSLKQHVGEFDEHRALGNAPLLVREHPEFKRLLELAAQVNELRSMITTSIKEKVNSQDTPADRAIRQLFEEDATLIDTDDDILFRKAWKRAVCHLPPGKGEDIGDRLAWLALLDNVPAGANLHIITDDTDFESEGFDSELRPYLAYEWKKKKGGAVRLWKRISEFLAANFPDAKDEIEFERNLLSKQLRDSSSFATTHAVIAKLKKFDEFSDADVRHIFEAFLENSQVRSISEDEDVNDFYSTFARKYESKRPVPDDDFVF